MPDRKVLLCNFVFLFVLNNHLLKNIKLRYEKIEAMELDSRNAVPEVGQPFPIDILLNNISSLSIYQIRHTICDV